MSENKKYYWLKLHDNFFDDDTIQYIEEQENGKEYVLFYLKLALKSLSREGYLIRYVGERVIPYDVKALAKLTNTPTDTVKAAMITFIDFGLVTQLESGELYLNQINEMIGKETQAAKRKREQRAREKQKELGAPNSKINNRDNVTKDSDIVRNSHSDVQKSHTEKEIEIDIELEKDREKDQSSIIQSFIFWEKNGFGDLAHHTTERMYAWFDDFKAKGSTQEQADQLMLEALKIAVEANARTWKFTEGVVRNWLNKGLITVEKMQAHEVQRAANKQYSNSKNYVRTETLPDWHDEENKGEEIDEKKAAEFRDRLERIRNRSNQV